MGAGQAGPATQSGAGLELHDGRSRQRLPQARDHQPANPLGVAEAQLGLRRMHVHVDRPVRQVEPQPRHREPSARDDLLIGDPQRRLQKRVGDRPAIHHQELRRPCCPMRRRGAGEAREADLVPLRRDIDQRRRLIRTKQSRQPPAPGIAGQVEDELAVMLQPEGDGGRGQRQAADHRLGVIGLDPARCAGRRGAPASRRTGPSPPRGCRACRRPAPPPSPCRRRHE